MYLGLDGSDDQSLRCSPAGVDSSEFTSPCKGYTVYIVSIYIYLCLDLHTYVCINTGNHALRQKM